MIIIFCSLFRFSGSPSSRSLADGILTDSSVQNGRKPLGQNLVILGGTDNPRRFSAETLAFFATTTLRRPFVHPETASHCCIPPTCFPHYFSFSRLSRRYESFLWGGRGTLLWFEIQRQEWRWRILAKSRAEFWHRYFSLIRLFQNRLFQNRLFQNHYFVLKNFFFKRLNN